MANTVRNGRQSDPVLSLENIRPPALKVGLSSDFIGLNDVLREAVIAHFGSVKATAIELGNCDPSLMQREFKAGNFSRVERHDQNGSARAAMADAMRNAYGPLAATPAARLRVLAKHTRVIADEMDQLSEHLA